MRTRLSALPPDLAPHTAWRNGQYRDAGRAYEQLRQHALRRGDAAAAARIALRVSSCWHLAGQSLRSLTVLAEAFNYHQADGDVFEIWETHRQMFDFIRCFKPQRCRLQEQLGRMRMLWQQDSRLPVSDLLRCEAVVARGKGDHCQVVQLLERAWQHHHPSRGLPHFILAHNAAWSSLERGDREGAGHWTRRLQHCDPDIEDSRAGWWDMQIRLALWDDNVGLLRDGGVHLRPRAHPYEQSVWWRRAAGLRVRCLLLDLSWGDPHDAHHPARQQLCRPAVAGLEVDDKFHRAILVVDYCLACLRYAIGLSSVDDLFHLHPPAVPSRSLKLRVYSEEVYTRVRKVHVAMTRATTIARPLDAVYRCQWRQDVVNVRRRRLEAIQEGLGPTPD